MGNELMDSGIVKHVFDTGMIKRGDIEESLSEIEVPEFNEMMGLEKGQVAVIKISQISLDSFLRLRQDVNDRMRNMMEGVIEASYTAESVKNEVKEALKKMHPETRYRLHIVKEGSVEPKFKDSDLVYISKMWPHVINRVYTSIMALTNKGASLKKNTNV